MACFRFVGPFWGVFGDFGVQNRHFSSFFVVTSPLREGVEVLGITPHLLNVSVLGTRHLWRVPSNALFAVSFCSVELHQVRQEAKGGCFQIEEDNKHPNECCRPYSV